MIDTFFETAKQSRLLWLAKSKECAMRRLIPILLIAMTTAPALAEKTTHDNPYVYKSLGKRDPFQPPVGAEPSSVSETSTDAPKKEQRQKEPLEAFQLDSLKLVAILLSNEFGGAAAMVQDSLGKGYLIRTGNHIGTQEGEITDIQEGLVTIQEPPTRPNDPPKIIVLRLHQEQENKLKPRALFPVHGSAESK
ncbi:MAG: pilus assembly protein PilP [Magnetococcus sp. YQC-5]